MKIHTVVCIFLLSVTISARAFDFQALAESPSSCEFYHALESKLDCANASPPSNYLEDYGHYYCTLFLELSASWLGKKNQWTKDTLVCLKSVLWQEIEEHHSCPDIEQIAFDSHPKCYADNGFCDLATRDKIDILRQIHCVDVFFKLRKSLTQAVRLIKNCTDEISWNEIITGHCNIL